MKRQKYHSKKLSTQHLFGRFPNPKLFITFRKLGTYLILSFTSMKVGTDGRCWLKDKNVHLGHLNLYTRLHFLVNKLKSIQSVTSPHLMSPCFDVLDTTVVIQTQMLIRIGPAPNHIDQRNLLNS